MMTLDKMTSFYKKEEFFCFLEPKRNLIYKMSRNGLCKMAHSKVKSIMQEIEILLDKIMEAQKRNKEETLKVSNIIAPVAPVLQLFTRDIAITAARFISRDLFLIDADGIQQFYFEQGDQRLEQVLKQFIEATLRYLTGDNFPLCEYDFDGKGDEEEEILQKANKTSFECHATSRGIRFSDIDLD